MPLYEYQSCTPEDPETSCYVCRSPFELRRAMADSHNLKCPTCNNPIVKLVSRVSKTSSERADLEKAKGKGFTVLKNLGDGIIEKQ